LAAFVTLIPTNKNMLHKTEDICSVREQVVRKPALAGIGRDLVRCLHKRQAGDRIDLDVNEVAVVIESAMPYIAEFVFGR